MSTWLIEPRDPLIVRDGRPIGGIAPIETVAFPYPSTVAGSIRTRMGSAEGTFSLRNAEVRRALWRIPVVGPILAEIDPKSGAVRDWLFPAPRDAVIRAASTEITRRATIERLIPAAVPPGCRVDALEEHGLLPVLAKGRVGGKSLANAPRFWRWGAFAEWLVAPASRAAVALDELGIAALPQETRTHVAIVPGERVSEDGNLFQTTGLRFLQHAENDEPGAGGLSGVREYVLSARCEERVVSGQELGLREELAPLGGERRLARFRPADGAWPALPAAVREQVLKTRRARLVLVTPAVFGMGALPAWSKREWPGGGPVRACVRAACVPSAEVISGWRLDKGTPKPTRRLAPAGSVYFVELEGGSAADVKAWVDGAWLECVSDAKKDRLDGFGLAAVGAWPEGVEGR